jgi:hypothetical protein
VDSEDRRICAFFGFIEKAYEICVVFVIHRHRKHRASAPASQQSQFAQRLINFDTDS